MSAGSTIRTRRREAGIALLISIFILLLISVVAIALVVSSGTESALAGNYRSATSVYYAALSGLEEARGRLLTKNASAFVNTAPPGFLPAPGTALPMGYVRYVLNPGPTESMPTLLATYPDTEYATEFGAAPLDVKQTASIWNRSPLNSLNVPGPLYKWVRINAVSEQSLNNLDTYPYDGTFDPTPLYYDYNGAHLNDVNSGSQVLEITALAVLPSGSQKLLQYLVALVPARFPDFPTGQLSFPAALTLSGSSGNPAAFHAPSSNSSYAIMGNDYDCNGNPAPWKYPAIGVFTNADALLTGPVIGGTPPGIPPAYRPNYTGVNNPGPYIPDVENISSLFPATLQTPSKLDALAQSIAQYADVTIPVPSGPITYPLPTVTGSALTPLGMSPTNPLTVVVNGNLDISNWSRDGYGLLLVLGKFTYDPDTTWDGMILVIGQGQVDGSHAQYKQINGAMFVAKTRDLAGNLLPDPNLGGAAVQFSDSMQGNGIRYSNCWIQKSQPTGGYKILSFHEIASQ
jgi:hypothetical protein